MIVLKNNSNYANNHTLNQSLISSWALSGPSLPWMMLLQMRIG
jgi:hypothetical protein